ncbi:MAG: radical SAM protein [Elusimicrobia bacterium]|nr:radical SAM protein [Elusimicrobiota bacterium]
MLRRLYRAVVPAALRERAAYAREWLALIANYLLVRSRCWKVGVRPHALYIEGTNICNAACVFCAYPQMQRPKVTMTMEVFRKAVDEYAALGLREVDLTPIVGDPFVDPHLFERLDYLKAKPEVKRFHFYTNTILLRPGTAERLMGYGERFWIFCSFGGFDRETYHRVMGVDRLEQAVANIRTLIETKKAAGSTVGLHVNLRVPKGNAKGEFWEYLLARQAEGLVAVDGVDDYDNWGGKIGEEVLRGAGLVPKPPPVHNGPCRRLLTGPVILADGRVNACCCRDVEATLIIGDVKTRPLADILSGPELKELIRRHERKDFPEICKTCTKYQSLWTGVRDD